MRTSRHILSLDRYDARPAERRHRSRTRGLAGFRARYAEARRRVVARRELGRLGPRLRADIGLAPDSDRRSADALELVKRDRQR